MKELILLIEFIIVTVRVLQNTFRFRGPVVIQRKRNDIKNGQISLENKEKKSRIISIRAKWNIKKKFEL